MSIELMRQAFASDLPPTPRLVLLALADHADDKGTCFPSVARLRRHTGLSERAVQNALITLSGAGWLTIAPNAGPKGTNLFHVRGTPSLTAPPQEMHPRSTCAKPPQEMRQPPAGNAPKSSRKHKEPSAREAGPVDKSQPVPQRHLPDLETRRRLSEELLGRKLQPGPRLTDEPLEDGTYLQ